MCHCGQEVVYNNYGFYDSADEENYSQHDTDDMYKDDYLDPEPYFDEEHYAYCRGTGFDFNLGQNDEERYNVGLVKSAK